MIAFAKLARTDPDRLLAMLNDLEAHDLTFAAEAVGLIESDAAIERLIQLLGHANPIVREGAVYGLARHVDHPLVLGTLTMCSIEDTSKGVREAAAEAVAECVS